MDESHTSIQVTFHFKQMNKYTKNENKAYFMDYSFFFFVKSDSKNFMLFFWNLFS